MDGRIARRLRLVTLAGVTAFILGLGFVPQAEAGTWRACRDRDKACDYYLNVTLGQGNARLSVDRTCRAARKHIWRRADARRTIRQSKAAGSDSVCIPLARKVDQIRITALGGHCGCSGGKVSRPGKDVTLTRGRRGVSAVRLTGCRATIGALGFGGIALDFADGYRFGDSYVTGHYYGLYDGFGRSKVRPLGVPARKLGRFNTYRYRVEILAGGKAWRKRFKGNDR